MPAPPYVYIVPLNIAQKVAFFFVWMVPFLIRTSLPPMTVRCLGLGLYQCGKTIANIGYTSLSGQGYLFLTVAFLLVLMVGYRRPR